MAMLRLSLTAGQSDPLSFWGILVHAHTLPLAIAPQLIAWPALPSCRRPRHSTPHLADLRQGVCPEAQGVQHPGRARGGDRGR